MADTGILLRRNIKSNLISNPPQIGELVYSTDTEEIGILENSTLVWKKFSFIGGEKRYNTFEFIATNLQTVFTGVDKNGKTLSITAVNNSVQGYINGVLLSLSDIILTDDTIILTSGAEINAIVTFIEYI